MARILITGANGFVGSHLVPELREHGHDVIGVDRHDGDLRDLGTADYLIGTYRPDVCVHLAAKVGRQFGEDDPGETIRDNATMTTLVAQACGRHGARLVYASTSEVYGDQGDDVCEEYVSDNRGHIHNLYALSKRWGEEAARLYAPEGLTTLRLSMPFGSGLPWGRGRAAIINMLWQALTRAPIPVHRNAERSWCHVSDTVRGIRMIIKQAETGVFNVGRDDNPRSMLEVAEVACKLTGAPFDLIEMVNAPANQTCVKRLSTARLRSLGWRPEVELEDGMRMVLAWIESRMAMEKFEQHDVGPPTLLQR